MNAVSVEERLPPRQAGVVVAATCSLIALRAGRRVESSHSFDRVKRQMTLSAGRRIGPYEILKLVGAGGMGEVYEARDPRLDRHVAVKVLPEAFTENEERVARFQREARLLAKLNHPSIASIHEVEKDADTVYLVMEMVPGETLAEQLSNGPLSLEEALPLFKQIAEALEAAHGNGVIHRDLKPANIKVTPEGRIKVLDFGLAKAFDEDPTSADSVELSHSPTMTREGTRVGAIMGTAAFMSPEQAKGRLVDKRADIWAFGCVLYEALTGRRAFEGETAAEILANVIKSEPDWDRLPAELPGGVRRILERCLTKDRSRRLRDIGEAWVILDEPEVLDEPRTKDIARPKTLALAVLAAFLLGSLVAGLASWTVFRSAGRDEIRTPRRLSIKLPPSQPLGGERVFALSPDGTALVYVANVGGRTRLVQRRLDENVSEEIPGTEDAQFPFFSPDGQWIGFLSSSDYQSSLYRDAALKKVSRRGGPVITLAPVPSAWTLAAWGDDGDIVFSSGSYPTEARLRRVSAAGGEPEALGGTQSGWLVVDDVLPGGGAVLVERGDTAGFGRVAVRSIEEGEEHVLAEAGTWARYVPTGHVVYQSPENVLFAIPFDADRLEATGPPVPVLERVGWYSFSQEGSLVYRLPPQHELLWVDSEGGETSFGPSPWPYRVARLSPDGTRLVVDESDLADLWLYDMVRGALTRLTVRSGPDLFPLWTPDGKHIVYVSYVEKGFDLMRISADGSGVPERILTSANDMYPYSWAGEELVVEENKEETGADISIISLDIEPKIRPFIEAPFDQTNPNVSPDGRWIAYESNESGRTEVYVQSLSGGGGRFQISTEGGTVPIWGRDGRELFYRLGNDVMRVSIETDSGFEPGQPTRLFSGDYRRRAGRAYELAPDGERFLMMRPVEEELSTELVFVLDWFDELERLAHTK